MIVKCMIYGIIVIVAAQFIAIKHVYSVPNQTTLQSSKINSEIEKYIEGLRSNDPVTRAVSATRLGEMGEKAFPAIEFLIATFNDLMLFFKVYI